MRRGPYKAGLLETLACQWRTRRGQLATRLPLTTASTRRKRVTVDGMVTFQLQFITALAKRYRPKQERTGLQEKNNEVPHLELQGGRHPPEGATVAIDGWRYLPTGGTI